ncbi:MAG: DUF262 domain-containing protein [Paludibacteraceae bacterium]
MDEYSLSNLLSTNTLIVPEIQREYVWGSKSNISVLQSFIGDINNRIVGEEPINVGFLYSYTVHGSEHYVIDGQQRLTSLVLLLFVLSFESDDTRSRFKEILRLGNPTMSFSYNVRPLTEIFLRDLFSHECKDSKSVRKQKWYLKEYDNDITIDSMLGALDEFSSNGKYSNINYDRLLQKVCFWYFDVQQTSQGEELYITMNSRGQKLTDSEQIKPRLFENLSNEDAAFYGKEWDKWEEYFYANRPQKEGNNVMSQVDVAINNFIRVVTELVSCNEHNELEYSPKITLCVIKEWYEALVRIPSEEVFKKEIRRLYGTQKDKNYMVLKSLLVASFLKVDSPREFERVFQTMYNKVIRRGKVKPKSLLTFLSDYRTYCEASGNNGFYGFILSGSDTTDVMDKKDRKKIAILQNQPDENIENTFWTAERHCVLNGDISPLLDWVCDKAEDFSYERFNQYYTLFTKLYPSAAVEFDKDDVQESLDFVRRALLTQKITDYPRHFQSWTNTNFAYEPKDWHALFVGNSLEMKAFFDKLLAEGDYKETMKKMIDDYSAEDTYGDFVKESRLLKYCRKKNIQWQYNTIYLIKGQKRNGKYANIHSYKYFIKNEDVSVPQNWAKAKFYDYEHTCVFYDRMVEDIQVAIDISWNSGKKHNEIEIACFVRDEDTDGEKMLQAVRQIGYKWEEGRYRYFLQPSNVFEAFELVDQKRIELMNYINNIFS